MVRAQYPHDRGIKSSATGMTELDRSSVKFENGFSRISYLLLFG